MSVYLCSPTTKRSFFSRKGTSRTDEEQTRTMAISREHLMDVGDV